MEGITTVRAVIRHPMENGFRKNADTGEMIPDHYIKHVTVTHNGHVILDGDWSRAVSKNPYMSLKFKGAVKGDNVQLTWTDNKNNSDTYMTEIE